MSTVKFHVPHSQFKDVYNTIKMNGVRYYPIRKVFGGYTFEIDDHPIVSYMILKYEITVSNLPNIVENAI